MVCVGGVVGMLGLRAATLVVVACAGWIAGCAQTSRVGDDATSAKLAATNKAVALMRIGSASPECHNVAVLLGRREGEGFRRHQAMTVLNVRSLTEVPVAELELDAGEYHVIGYSCHTQKGPQMITDSAGGALFRTSYAHFRLEPGEVVNLGYFHFGASKTGRSVFGRPVKTDVDVGDWPLAEIERFKAKRPAVFAQMKTRLMTVGDALPTPNVQRDQCETWRRLQADGKAQGIPAACVNAEKPKA
jgi:hypothetical protein